MNACLSLPRRLALAAAGALVAAAPVWAADPPPSSQERYRAERAACESGWSHQDRATCLKEAGAAREEARRGQLDGANTQYQRNAMARCDALPQADRADCQARVRGEGTARGSVEAGGIYKETVTRELPAAAPVAPAPVQPAASSLQP
ncbi:hypothetical protein [Eleftheria terrae]|uniref:hypothetical protein n=1 Tax=Eleftheria terrae TaxID=1597781 RepID=UPI00263A78B1|nr:hypothetical protein [Eleftheria terrae]WKB53867.1 hypothetical protein N7L95_05635 [Eleftheria terrae]